MKVMHILGHFPSSINLKQKDFRTKNFKTTRRFGSWLCFRHQVGPLERANLNPWTGTPHHIN
jgi:hypothetical protein